MKYNENNGNENNNINNGIINNGNGVMKYQ
jgi:hypothetical protein